MATTTQPARPPAAGRVLAPDLARGLMLLLIALANVPWHTAGSGSSGRTTYDPDASLADRVWQAVATAAVDGRSYPLFAFLFGYGIWQLYDRQVRTGTSPQEAHRLLRRRHAWMLVFGAVHAALLWGGDILGAYGLVGLLVCWLLLDRRDRTVAVWAGALGGLLAVAAVVTVVAGVLVGAPEGPGAPADLPDPAAAEGYAASVVLRSGMWAVVTLGQGLLTLAVPAAVLLGVLAARHGVLQHPDRHRRLLLVTAATGIPLAWGAGTLAVAQAAGAFPGIAPWTFDVLVVATGLAGGLGYAAAFALVAAAWQRRGLGRAGDALVAVGRRSMTCYLLQSLLFAPVLAAWGLGFGTGLTDWQTALYAVAVWFVTVAVAVWLDRAGQRGPFERLLRHLAYPRPTLSPAPTRDASTTRTG